MKKLNRFLALFVALFVQISFAQDKTVSGNVSDESGMPLAGVNIIVQGTSSGTQSDFDGNYSIIVDEGSVLTYSYVGYNSISQEVGSSNRMNITLSEGEALEEVVVTAFGIAREKKALGYAVSEVDSEQIEQRTEGDVARVLSGKASGVAITSSSGTSGSATNVVIRGYSSVNGNNQALFVVDGIPFQSDTNSQGGFNGVGSSRFLDLDPNNIESVNVLKGLAASTLYGAQGKNGVIVITTKSGSLKPKGPKKTEITVNQSYFVNEIASMPDYQNEYGGGFDQSYGVYYSNWGPAFRKEGVDGWGNDPAGVIDENGTVPHPYGNDPVNGSSFLANFLDGNNVLFQTYGDARYDWRPYKSAENFFRSGGISNTNVNVRGASEDLKLSYNVNYGHLEEEGFTPGNNLRRDALSVGGRAELSNKFTVTASLNYADTYMVSPPVGASLGGGDYQWSVFGNVFFKPFTDYAYHIGDHVYVCETEVARNALKYILDMYEERTTPQDWAVQKSWDDDTNTYCAEQILAFGFLQALGYDFYTSVRHLQASSTVNGKTVSIRDWNKQPLLDSFNVFDIDNFEDYVCRWAHENIIFSKNPKLRKSFSVRGGQTAEEAHFVDFKYGAISEKEEI